MAAPPGEQRAFASFTSQTQTSQTHSPVYSPVGQGQTVAEMDTHGGAWGWVE